MQILAARLAERQRRERREELDALSGEKRDVAFGSQIRTYTLAPYQLVKDERTRYETGNVQAVLDGDLDGVRRVVPPVGRSERERIGIPILASDSCSRSERERIGYPDP